ncbi:hypothetical protein Ancab_030801 [Ancistrocladus abbreviatus]
MLSSLKDAAKATGKSEWVHTRPTNAGHYNTWLENTPFSIKKVAVGTMNMHYGTCSHVPKLTAGHYNKRFRDGYFPIARMLACHGAVFSFTCIEMRGHEQSQDTLCAPEELVRQELWQPNKHKSHLPEKMCCQGMSMPMSKILKASLLNIDGNSSDREMCAFTYLRMNLDLFQADNWINQCWKQVEMEAEHFMYVTEPLVQEAAVAIMH